MTGRGNVSIGNETRSQDAVDRTRRGLYNMSARPSETASMQSNSSVSRPEATSQRALGSSSSQQSAKLPPQDSRPRPASSSWIYQNSPSLPEMEQSKVYRKTLKKYRMLLQKGMMIQLEDLEDFPAPVLCPFCEIPTISVAKTERSGGQRYAPSPRCVRSCNATRDNVLAHPDKLADSKPIDSTSRLLHSLVWAC